MKRLVLAMLACSVACGSRASWAEDLDLPRIARLLRSGDRDQRFEGIRIVEGLKVVPEELVAPLVAFTRAELETALVPPPGALPGPDSAEKAPPLGDEVSPIRLQADPRKFVGKTFVLRGGLRVSGDYDGGYRAARNTHYAFDFEPVPRVAEGPRVHLYVDRRYGAALAEVVTQAQERGAPDRLARLRCTILTERCGHDEGEALASVEVSDWQFPAPGDGGWSPWAFDGVRTGFAMLGRAGAAAAPALVAMVADAQEFQGQEADALLRALAIHTLAEMDEEGRTRAFARLQRLGPKLKNPKVHAWASRAANVLRNKRRR